MNDRLYFTRDSSEAYRDLRPLQDDITIQKNPHKGWYIHYVDNGYRFWRYRDTIKEGDDLKWLPGLNHMYLRLDWSDIENEEGVYDWSAVDAIMDKWGPLGYRFSFRLCTCEANRPMIPYSTPKWVFDKGAKFTLIRKEGRSWLMGTDEPYIYETHEPDYGDPIYLEYLERFMAEYGRKFNGDPRVEFIDVGTVGQFGEGNYLSAPFPPEVLKKHVDLHLRYFPDTHILVNDDLLKHAGIAGREEGIALAEHCAAHGLGIRDDSVYVRGYMEHNGSTMLAAATAFDMMWKYGPTDLESAHMLSIDADGLFDDGFRYLDAMKRSHCTYAGFHGDPYKWYEKHKYISDFAANRLGYWYFLNGCKFTDTVQGANTFFKLSLTNHGFAPAYHAYEFRCAVISESGEEIPVNILDTRNGDCRAWLPDEENEICLKLATRVLPTGKYTLCLGMVYAESAEKETPIRFAIQEKYRTESGLYKLAEFNVY